MGERKVSGGRGWLRILWRIREIGSVVVDVGAGRRVSLVLGESVGAGRRGGLRVVLTRELPREAAPPLPRRDVPEESPPDRALERDEDEEVCIWVKSRFHSLPLLPAASSPPLLLLVCRLMMLSTELGPREEDPRTTSILAFALFVYAALAEVSRESQSAMGRERRRWWWWTLKPQHLQRAPKPTLFTPTDFMQHTRHSTLRSAVSVTRR